MKKYAYMKRWFQIEKKFDLHEQYHCTMLEKGGEVIGETEKAYKIAVRACFLKSEKIISVWCPKSCIESVCEF